MANKIKKIPASRALPEAVKCSDCRNSTNPAGYPVVISCKYHDIKLVANSIRKCLHFSKK